MKLCNSFPTSPAILLCGGDITLTCPGSVSALFCQDYALFHFAMFNPVASKIPFVLNICHFWEKHQEIHAALSFVAARLPGFFVTQIRILILAW